MRTGAPRNSMRKSRSRFRKICTIKHLQSAVVQLSFRQELLCLMLSDSSRKTCYAIVCTCVEQTQTSCTVRQGQRCCTRILLAVQPMYGLCLDRTMFSHPLQRWWWIRELTRCQRGPKNTMVTSGRNAEPRQSWTLKSSSCQPSVHSHLTSCSRQKR